MGALQSVVPTRESVKWKELDLDALRHNYGMVRRQVGVKHIIASVKANAYGHGIVPVVRALDEMGVYRVATGSIADVRAIRAAELRTQILMFACTPPEYVAELVSLDVALTVHNGAVALAISRSAKSDIYVYVKIDSGLGRLGVPIAEAADFISVVAALPNIRLEGLYTHLPFSHAVGREWARDCMADFQRLHSELTRRGIQIPITQAIASAGIVGSVINPCTAVCPGHLLYGGLSLVRPDVGDLSDYRPVLKAIKCRLIDIGRRPAGKPIGMNGDLIPASDLTVGVVPFGLADGYHRPISGRNATMLFRQHRVRVLGVSLEYTLLDLSEVRDATLGEEVVVLGRSEDDEIGLPEIADWQGMPVLDTLMSFDKPMPTYIDPA
jgi:alanine racemase